MYKTCPLCTSVLTPWPKSGYVCDCCGYGKRSIEEFDKLQSEVQDR